MSQKKLEWKEHWQEQKEKSKFCCQHKLNLENALVNSIKKGPFTSPNKALFRDRRERLNDEKGEGS